MAGNLRKKEDLQEGLGSNLIGKICDKIGHLFLNGIIKLMNRLIPLLLTFTLLTLAACTAPPRVKPTTAVTPPVQPEPIKPVKPSRPPVLSELVGRYSLFAGSDINFELKEQGGKLLVFAMGRSSELKQISPTRFQLAGGREVNFQYSAEGKYDRFVTMSDGRNQRFIRDDSLARSRKGVTNQAVYTWQMINALKAGDYTHSRFISPSRGLVDYSVYLPSDWRRDSKKTYPLIIYLHGQTGWEHSFSEAVPAAQLNQWMARGLIPPTVIVALRSGRIGANGRTEEQWSSPRNEKLITSESSNELRAFIRQQFRAGMSAKTTSIHGHSRGSRGAIHYALKFPDSFASAVANAFVSDYALPETMQIATQNQQRLRTNGIPLRMSIGDRDEFVLNMGRKATPVMHQHLNQLGIPHQYQLFSGIDHSFAKLWNVRLKNGMPNGLSELQFHAGAWAK